MRQALGCSLDIVFVVLSCNGLDLNQSVSMREEKYLIYRTKLDVQLFTVFWSNQWLVFLWRMLCPQKVHFWMNTILCFMETGSFCSLYEGDFWSHLFIIKPWICLLLLMRSDLQNFVCCVQPTTNSSLLLHYILFLSWVILPVASRATST